ncbi:hypothetical protein CsatA_022549 [Cannabis sativa]
MELDIVSRELITPSSQTHHLEPYKLCLIDQISPKYYFPVILFYSNSDAKLFDLSKTLTQMKISLSETLNLYYPLSGRAKDDQYIDDFQAGVPFFETKINWQMSEFFQREIEFHDQLLPFQPFGKTPNNNIPPIAFQVNIFGCGGIALGIVFYHMIMDAATMSNFLKSWAAFSSGSTHKVINPNLVEGTILFPPKEIDFLNDYTSVVNRFFFNEGEYTAKRFIFAIESIQTLIEMAKSKHVPNPTRNLAVTCFIWKHIMAAYWADSEPNDLITACQVMNIRPRMKSRHNGDSLDGVVGNLVGHAGSVFDPNNGHQNVKNSSDIKLSDLVRRLKEAMEGFEDYFLCQVKKGGEEASSEMLEQVGNLSLLDKLGKPNHFISFTNWKGFFKEVDFGFGKSFKVEPILGKIMSNQCGNMVILVDADRWGIGSMEVFIILEHKQVSLLERDENFLAFTSKSS